MIEETEILTGKERKGRETQTEAARDRIGSGEKEHARE